MMQESGEGTLWMFLLLGGLCQGLNMFYAFQILQRWGDQIREELDSPEE
jgi:hypothetical protein